jgi:biotin-(acetyl-CoA carboxylase) ligase
LNYKPKEINFSKMKKKISDLLHKLQFTFEKVLKIIVKSLEKIVKSYNNSCALAHPIVKSYDKIVNKIVNECMTA